jgi:hypothetical protein
MWDAILSCKVLLIFAGRDAAAITLAPGEVIRARVKVFAIFPKPNIAQLTEFLLSFESAFLFYGCFIEFQLASCFIKNIHLTCPVSSHPIYHLNSY